MKKLKKKNWTRKKAIKPAKRRKVLGSKKPKSKIKKTARKRKPANKNRKIKIAKKSKSPKKVLRARKAPKKAKKPAIKIMANEFPAESLFKARIKVIGIGGGGGSIVSEIGRSLEKATFLIADTDIRALKKRSAIKYFWFGEDLTHGLGTGVNVELAKRAAESAQEKFSGIFKDQDIIIFIASLGGGLGSGATQIFAEAAREFGGITFGIFTLPFKFEGKNKYRIAQNALKILRRSLNVSLTIPNEKIFKIIDANTPITEAFSTVNKSLIESLESLIDLIYNPGVINIDFADLRTILNGIGNSAFLNTVEQSGKNRADKICEKILSNPLLQSQNLHAEKILFNIAGSEKLSMLEVEKISRHISNLNPRAKIIFGISKNSKLKNKIKTTILMTGGSVAPEEISAEKDIIKPEKPKIEEKPDLKKQNKFKRRRELKTKKPKSVSFIPVFENPISIPISPMPALEQKKMNIVEAASLPAKKTIRRSALEIKKAEEQEEKKRIDQEKEWEIPAFLRRVKFNK